MGRPLMNLPILVPLTLPLAGGGIYTCYFTSLIRVADLSGRLAPCSTVSSRLHVPHVRLSSIGSHAFLVTGPQVWNNLPEHVTSADSLHTFYIYSRLNTPNAAFILLVSVLSLWWSSQLFTYLGHALKID